MGDNINRIIKSTQEQAVASWVTYLNQIRLDELISHLMLQDVNLQEALMELNKIKDFIGNPEHILGSEATKHGEIAEQLQVRFSNAMRLIRGKKREYTFDGVGRTAPEDYLKNGRPIQSKFYNGSKNTLKAIQMHLNKYPYFVKEGGSYDIPKDQYNQMVNIIKSSKENPSALSKEEMRILEAIRKFERETGLDLLKDVKPSVVNYSDAQKGNVNNTVRKEEKKIYEADKEERKKAYESSKPTLNEGIKTSAVSAGIEGGMTFCMAVVKKRKEGKHIQEFTACDWKEVGIETGASTAKGAIRGGTMYALTNFTATPANVASAYVTATFGVISQAWALEKGSITADDFIINSEAICLDVTVSAISSIMGEVLIPIPILGAIIGNIAGEFIYSICKETCGKREQNLILKYSKEMEEFSEKLNLKYSNVVTDLKKRMERFSSIEELAFDKDINQSFFASGLLAVEVGVPVDEILTSIKNVDSFFLN